MPLPDSCLSKYLSQYVELDDAEVALVSTFETRAVTFPKSHRIRQAGERIEHLFAVKSGWLFTSTNLPDGRRHLLRVCVPGDLIGLSDIGYAHATNDLNTCNDVVLCSLPRQEL